MEYYGNLQQQQQPKVIRAKNLKRGRADERNADRIKLERVLGVTVSNNAALASDPHSGTIAYAAGCTVVIFNTLTKQQSHIINISKKTIISLAYSSCGRYIVTGECGHQPAVRIWDTLAEPQSAHVGLAPQVPQIAEFVGHKYGISCVAFSPTNKFVVSVGTQHDMIVNVWDWKNNIKVASNKVSVKVKSIAFADNGSYFVTVGNRLVKFWYLEYGKNKYKKETVPLMGRPAILGEQRNNYFCDVSCGKGQCADSTYVITRSGLLCELNNRRLLDKWVELRTTSANCLYVSEQYIFVGCADGITRCFDPYTLKFVTTLPLPHYLGVDVALGQSVQHMSAAPPNSKYPDTIAVAFDDSNKKLTCVYNDHSVYVWDVTNMKRVGKAFSFLYHSACIWGVEMAPANSVFPAGSFLTCSSDDTIRVWTLDALNDKTARGMYRRNAYSKELLKVVYIDKELTYLKNLDLSGSNTNADKQDSSYDGRNGVRAIRLSPDGKYLASGDRSGTIHVHETSSMGEVYTIGAHDAEVLCLEFSNPLESTGGHRFMASASRDRLIHVFDVNGDFNFVQTLDDHSSSITSVRFLTSPHGTLQMVSCGADKSLLFRSLGETPTGTPQFQRGHNATSKTTLYDMEVDAGQKHVLTACQDRNVRVYSVGTGKHTKSFKGSTGEEGTLIKVVLDRSGIYLATSCTDKSLAVYDYYTGECMATMRGHSELVTGLRFTNDCKRLISASGDGCIFVWQIPHDMVVTMQARLAQQALRQGKTVDRDIFENSSEVEDFDVQSKNIIKNNYRFSIGQLPHWAKKHISEEATPPSSMTKRVAAPKGRWAQRAEQSVVAHSYCIDTVLQLPQMGGGGGTDDMDNTFLDETIKSDDHDFTICEDSISSQLFDGERLNSNITVRSDMSRSSLDASPPMRDPENEWTAHDADIDSDQENRNQPLYYPTNADSASGSEFTVTNMDVEELRKSMRRSKTALPQPLIIEPTSISGSQDSDRSDDEVSTPSGDAADRNPLSMLSASSESIDQIVIREKYLQSTFESLSGAEIDSPSNKTSISSQYHTRNSLGKVSNIDLINAAKQTKNDPETQRKREELQKRITETKKKLQSIGHSPLKYSQSIVDLSHIPEKENRSRNRKSVQIDDDNGDYSLRRACSLSDLSVQGPVMPKRSIDQEKTIPRNSQMNKLNNYSKLPRIVRSRSSSVLNQSDSDESEKKPQNRLMRPTISSQNKVTNSNGNNNNGMRKRHSHSVMNLSNVGQADSSSEEMEKFPQPSKPLAPPRTRLHTESSNRRHTTTRERTASLRTTAYDKNETTDDSYNDPKHIEISTARLTTQLCDDVANQLTRAADNVAEIYRRLMDPSDEAGQERSGNNSDMVRNLERSIANTQKLLQDITLKRFRQSNSIIDLNQTDTAKKLNDLVSKGLPNDQNAFVTTMQMYSEILLAMMQKIQESPTT